MARSFGISELLNASFKERKMSEQWVKHIGHIERNATIIIMGPAKNGKTDYTFKMIKDLALNQAQVFYNTSEEGKSKTLQETAVRNNMQDVVGKVMFGHRLNYEQLFKKITSPRSGNVLVIDSWDYMNLSAEQFKTLRETIKNKLIIILCWAHGKRPDNAEARKIEHMADCIIHVKNWVADPVSRFGGNEKMVTRKMANNQSLQQSLFHEQV